MAALKFETLEAPQVASTAKLEDCLDTEFLSITPTKRATFRSFRPMTSH
jgi:hypothetical protein